MSPNRAADPFAQSLERTDSEAAQQITKDPYILDFLALDGAWGNRQLRFRSRWPGYCGHTSKTGPT